MRTLAARSPHGNGVWVTAVALVSALACFPREDLSEYSRTWDNQPGGAGGGGAGPARDAGVDAGGSAGQSPLPGDAGSIGVDAGTLEPVDAGSLPDAGVGDAGSDAAAAPVDAGALDPADAALTLAASCAALDGALEPGTRNCFVVSATTATWQGAADACVALDMQLVTITSPAQDDFVATLTPAAVWIGARDPAFFNFPAFASPAANAFSWLDGSAVEDINWAAGEPGATVGEYCIEKSNQAGGEPWFDRDCNLLQRFVCQQVL